MDKNQLDIMNDVMSGILSHPISKAFIDPLEDYDVVSSDFHKIVKKPMDFTKILDNIKEKKYKNIETWISDVNLVMGNAEKYFGEDTEYYFASKELRRIFHRFLDQKMLNGWCDRVYKLRSRIDKLVHTPPLASMIGATFDYKKELVEQLLTEKDMTDMSQALEKLTDPQEQSELISIISSYQPELVSVGKNIVCDITKFRLSTFNALKSKMVSILESKGLKYPE